MEAIGRDVRRELDRFGVEGEIANLVAVWPATVGETVARNAWPARVARDGTLHVATASSAWAFELSQLAPELLTRLREAAGGRVPAALRFSVGAIPERTAAGGGAQSGTAPVEPAPEERELATALASEVADSELRDLVARAAAASLARAGHGRAV